MFNRSNLSALLIATLVVTSPILGFLATTPQPANAVHDCSTADAFVATFSFGLVNNDKCFNNHVAHALDKEDSQTELDIYQASLAQGQSNTNWEVALSNNLPDSETTAFSKGEAAFVRSYENGSSKTLARSEAKTAVKDYYTRKQINYINAWNTSWIQWAYLHSAAAGESGINANFVNYQSEVSCDSGWYCEVDTHNVNVHINGNFSRGYETTTITLINGSTRTIIAPEFHIRPTDGCGPTDKYYTMTPGNIDGRYSWNIDDACETNKGGMYYHNHRTNAPDNDYNTAFWWDAHEWGSEWANIITHKDNVIANIDAYTGKLYDELEAGNVSAKEYVNPLTLAQEFSQDYEDTGYWRYAVASLSMNGMATPQLENTSYFNITYKGTKYQGLVMAQDGPFYNNGSSLNNGTYYRGETYNTSTQFTGLVLFIDTDGNRMQLDGKFTIQDMKDNNGSTIEESDTQEYNYQTTDTTDFEKKSQSLTTTRLIIEEEQVTSSGGSTTSGEDLAWLSQTYFGIPVWGYFGGLIIGLVLVNNFS